MKFKQTYVFTVDDEFLKDTYGGRKRKPTAQEVLDDCMSTTHDLTEFFEYTMMTEIVEE